MKFYNRTQELLKFKELKQLSLSRGRMTFLVGRRRIGKTMLMLEATSGEPTLYFFVARKSEVLLCQDFAVEIQEKLGLPVLGEPRSFAEVFRYLMEISKSRPFNLLIDEFQEFLHINSSVYSDIQHYWDVHHRESKMHLVLCGSVYSMMHRIFEDEKEPLYGRADHKMHIRPFGVSVLKEIMAEQHPGYEPQDLLALFAFTGGVARYIQWFVDHRALTFESMVEFISAADSPFIQEGKTLLIQEFGKEYGMYFSILSAIAQGHTTRSKMESFLSQEVGGGYLSRLESDYQLITRVSPLFASSGSANLRYSISDNFLHFWFRYLFKYNHFIESGNHLALKEIIIRDYPTFSGRMLERYFAEKFREEGQSTRIGGYWDRKGENEIDLIVLNEMEKRALMAEVKMKSSALRLERLNEKVVMLMLKESWLRDWGVEVRGLSLEDL